MSEEDLIYRLRKRAEIRRGATDRRSVQEGKPDRLSDLLEEAADVLQGQALAIAIARHEVQMRKKFDT